MASITAQGMSDDALKSDVLQLYRTYDPPPKDFDPRTASDEQLRRHGIPRRPDPEREPKLARLWWRAFARKPKFIKAELAIDRLMSRRNPLRGSASEFSGNNWGGAFVRSSALGFGEPATFVTASWMVPEIVPVAPQPWSTFLVAGFWVGLDGMGNGQVLQAGIAASVTTEGWSDGNFTPGSVYWWPWTEWFTTKFQDPAVKIDNFPIATGNTVVFIVCAQQPDVGEISVLNVSTGQATRVTINARPGIRSEGATAEWIVEGVSAELPPFYPMTFGSCAAGTQHHLFDLTPDGQTTEIVGGGGANLTQTQIAGPNTAVVYWEKWQ